MYIVLSGINQDNQYIQLVAAAPERKGVILLQIPRPWSNKAKLMLTAFMFLSTLSACDKENATNPPKEQVNNPPVTNGDPSFSRYEPPIELSFVRKTDEGLESLINGLPGETLEDNRWTRLMKRFSESRSSTTGQLKGIYTVRSLAPPLLQEIFRM